MAIIQNDGFYFLDGVVDKCIAIEADRLDEYIDYINRNKIKSVYLCSLFFRDKEIDFLKEINFIEKLNITSSGIENFQVLHDLHDLNSLSIGEPEGILDLSHNLSLKELSIAMNKNVIGIEKLRNVKVLRLWNYKPKSKSLNELSDLNQIEELKITNSSIESFGGCGSLNNLKKLELNYLRKLYYIDELEKLHDTIKVIEFNSCKKIVNHSYVACLDKLEKLSFNECSDIRSIDFIEKMHNLKWFVFMNTNVIDGNMNPCKRLEYVAFTNKKHFTNKNEEFHKNNFY